MLYYFAIAMAGALVLTAAEVLTKVDPSVIPNNAPIVPVAAPAPSSPYVHPSVDEQFLDPDVVDPLLSVPTASLTPSDLSFIFKWSLYDKAQLAPKSGLAAKPPFKFPDVTKYAMGNRLPPMSNGDAGYYDEYNGYWILDRYANKDQAATLTIAPYSNLNPGGYWSPNPYPTKRGPVDISHALASKRGVNSFFTGYLGPQE